MAEKILVSSYSHVKDEKPKDTPLDDFLTGIREGKWQDRVLAIRTISDKKERAVAKQKCPLVRVSGSFSGQADKDLRKHSGIIAIDIDGVEKPNTVKELVANDPYLYSAFISISGTGLCLLFRIDGTRHLDSFEAIASYLYDSYQIITDQSGKNVSRARFVSYDPYLIHNASSLIFKKYLPKKKAKPVNQVVFVKSDFDEIITQMYSRGVNVCETYPEWVATAYSLISEFGTNGTAYYHTLSSLSSKYNATDTDRQYENCLRSHGEGKAKTATIASIYFFAKQAGIDIYSSRTKEVIRATIQQSKAGSTPDAVAGYLQKFQEIPISASTPIIEQVISKNIEFSSENIIDDIQSYLATYQLRKNIISRNVEMNGRVIDDSDINSIFIDIKSIADKVTKDLVCSVIYSNRTEQFNPIKDFLQQAPDFDPFAGTPNLDLLLDSMPTDTSGYRKWVTKWLVSLISTSYGNYSPLTLVLAGEVQGGGKTHWFRYLLPKELRNLYAESKMDAGKDDEILMTKKLIIMDDEYGGKSKKEYTRQKEVTSKEWVNVREPYGRITVDLRRLAMFGGTSNDLQIISDPTGNRRVIPIHITGYIDRDKYNACDKASLMYELYHLYKDGYDYSILGDDIIELNSNTDQFKISNQEEELICVKLEHGGAPGSEWLSITQIIQYLINETKINSLSNTRIGMVLTNMKFEKKRKWTKETNNTTIVFHVNKIGYQQRELPFQ